MGLLNLFGGNKATSSSTAQTDDRAVLGQDAVMYELNGSSRYNTGTILEGRGNSLTTSTVNNIAVTDFGAIEQAALIAKDAAKRGAEVANGALSGAFHFGTDAIGLSADALDFGVKALSGALDFGGNAMDYANGAFSGALAANGRATSNALGFGETALDGALRSAGNSLDAGFSSMVEALGFGRASLASSASAWGAANASADASRDRAFGLVDSVVGNTVDVLNSRASAESASLRGIYETALGNINTTNARLGDAYADSQGRGALTDKMLMLAIGGAMLVAVFAVRKG